MAVAHESATESHTGTAGSTSEASFDISVPFTSSSKGLLVYTFVLGNAGDLASSVKIDPTGANTDVPAVSGGRAVDTAGELGDCKAWFLGSGLPTTTTTVRINRTNNAEVMYAVAITVTASGNTEVHTSGIVLLQEDGTLAEQSVDDGSPGTDSVRYAGLYSGLTDTGTTIVGANSTSLHFIDIGPRGAHVVRETTAGQGSRSVGFTSATNDDRAGVHLAIKEAAGATTVTPATVATTSTVPTPTVTAGAVVTPAAVATSSTVPTPSIAAGALVQPDVVATTSTVPTPTITAGAVVTPDAVATTSTVPTPTIQAGAVVTPDAVATVSTVPTPTISIEGETTVTPDVVTTVSTVPTPTIQAGAVVTPDAVVTTSTVPTPAVQAGAVVTPNVVSTTSTVPTPTIQGGVVVNPATVVTVSTVPTPTITAGAVVTPNVVVTISTVPTPTIQAGPIPTIDLPPSAVIGELNPEGAVGHRNRTGALSARDRTGTIR